MASHAHGCADAKMRKLLGARVADEVAQRLSTPLNRLVKAPIAKLVSRDTGLVEGVPKRLSITSAKTLISELGKHCGSRS